VGVAVTECFECVKKGWISRVREPSAITLGSTAQSLSIAPSIYVCFCIENGGNTMGMEQLAIMASKIYTSGVVWWLNAVREFVSRFVAKIDRVCFVNRKSWQNVIFGKIPFCSNTVSRSRRNGVWDTSPNVSGVDRIDWGVRVNDVGTFCMSGTSSIGLTPMFIKREQIEPMETPLQCWTVERAPIESSLSRTYNIYKPYTPPLDKTIEVSLRSL